ncbi:putative nitrile hydratase accessory protein [Variovorax paradoxus B4]|uniref:Putative nitrile hydratase accessory protein n=1 Tax=Variovorax paradoxus B4 TaxID=1246301 RepID=T1X953_VARPD|nr:nitrile hydratase accessory protein [Variovorax paradoxus]AGU48864.1 putative nitrile hydratase accessory protein [Variovorax paradoxus B4]
MNSGVPPLALAPGMPRDADGPVFNAPWEAQAFAMTLALHERGLFTWVEWAEVLAAQIAAAQAAGDPDTGNTYYRHWLGALESLVARKGASSEDELVRYRHAWDRAADRTPHGRPIELRGEDFS